MRAPDFWTKGGSASLALAPLGWLWAAGSAFRGRFATPYRAPVPVICVGNLVAGGAGKTPVALALGQMLERAHFVTRGYGGHEVGPLAVDPRRHSYARVGDEPLLLAEVAPCWVAKDRAAGARAAVADGARCLILDDGMQNPSVAKDVSLVVVDGQVGFGNGRCMPAGPLREPIARGLERAGAVVVLGEDRSRVARLVARLRPSLPVLRARLEAEAEADSLRGRAVVAFAGIGRPAKFFETLETLGATLAEAYAFPDHHPYHPKEIADLLAVAERRGVALITTAKDLMRVPPALREQVTVLRVSVAWEDEAALRAVLRPFVGVPPLPLGL